MTVRRRQNCIFQGIVVPQNTVQTICHTDGRQSTSLVELSRCNSDLSPRSPTRKWWECPDGNRGLLLLTPADGNLQGSLSPQLQTHSMYTKDTIQPELYLYSRIFVHGLTVGSYVPHSRKSFRVDFIASAQPHQPFVFPKKGCTKKSYWHLECRML